MPDLLRSRLRDSGQDAVRGITMVNVCFLLLTIGDVATVWALPVMGVVGAMIGRGLAGGSVVAVVALGQAGGLYRLRPRRVSLVAFRSVIHAAASLTWYIAWSWSLGLADSYAVGYAAPLMMLVLAGPMLSERIGLRRWAATGIGFLGMLVMLRPGGDLWTGATLLLLCGVAAMAVSRNLTRLLSTTETPECLAFWLLAAHVPVGVAMLAGGFPLPGIDTTVIVCLTILGVSNGLAHWIYSRACALAPMGALAPYEYAGLIWAGLFGYLAFAQVPSGWTMGGAGVVVAAGLYNFVGEQRRSRAERTAFRMAGAGG